MNHEIWAWVWSIPCWDSKNFNELRQLRNDQTWTMSRRKHALLILKQDESYEIQVNVIHTIKYVQITSQWNLMTRYIESWSSKMLGH